MSKLVVHAGDFAKGKESRFAADSFILKSATRGGFLPKFDRLPVSDVEEIDQASEESVKRIGGTVGWGVAGGVLLGPVGLLAGLLAGGRGKDVTFVARFKDGRRVLATTNAKTWTQIQAAMF